MTNQKWGARDPLCPMVSAPMIRPCWYRLETNVVFVAEQFFDGFRQRPLELGVKAVEAAVHADRHDGLINAPHQRRYT